MFAQHPHRKRSFGRIVPALICLACIGGGLVPPPVRALPAAPPAAASAYPSRAVVDPGTGHLFVAGPATNTTDAGPKGGLVRTFDGTTGALLARATLAAAPLRLALDPAGGQVLALEAGGQVEALDTRTGALRHPSTQPLFPLRSAIDARTGRGFALKGDAVRVFDARTGATLRTVPVEVNPIGLVVDEQGGGVLVVSGGPNTPEYHCNNGCGGSVAMLDAASGALLATTRFPDVHTPNLGSTYADEGPIALLFDGQRHRLYISRAEGRISVFDSANGKPIREFPGGGILLALDTGSGILAMVGNFGERATPPTGTVTLIDPTSGKTLASLSVSGHLAAPVIDGARHRLYLIHDYEALSVDTRNGAEIRTYPLPAGATDLALDAQHGRLYAADADEPDVPNAPGGPTTPNTSHAAAPLAIVPTAALEPAPGAVAVAGDPIAVASDPASGHTFVASIDARNGYGSPTPGLVTMLDSASGAVLSTTAVGANPAALAVDTRRGRVYVSDAGAPAGIDGSAPGAPDLTILDARSGRLLSRVARAIGGLQIGELQVDEASGHLFFLQINNPGPPVGPGAPGAPGAPGTPAGPGARFPANALVSLDAGGAVLHSTPLPYSLPRVLLLDPKAGMAYVGTDLCARPCRAAITAIDERTGAVIRTIAVPHEVQQLAMDPATGHLIAAHDDIAYAPGGDTETTTMSIIDPAAGAILHAVTLPFATQLYSTGPLLALATPSGSRVYLAAPATAGQAGSGAVAILDAATGALLTRTTLPDPPLQLTGDGPLGRIQVLTTGNAVATIDATNGRILAVTPMGVTTSNDSRIGGRLLGLDPRAGRLFVACPPSQSVSVLDARTGHPASR